jgi:predicted enzyme related to lactoylglutathione lyase
MSAPIKGRFVWHELMTSDPAGAQKFYSTVVGWGTAPWQNDAAYTLWMNGQSAVGGCMALPGELSSMGIPPHWLSHIGSPNVDQTCAEIGQLGGTVRHGPDEVPNVGRFAVVADPQGAVFSIYTPASAPPAADGTPKVGEFSWHELAATDPDQGFQFYRAVFGWEKTGDFDMGPMGIYQMFGFGGVPMGGIFKKPAEVPVANWLPYAKVNSADQAAEAAKANGGQIIQGPIEVPGGDRVAIGMDPQGAAFAVHSGKDG